MATGAARAAGNIVRKRVNGNGNATVGRSIGVGKNIVGGRRAGGQTITMITTDIEPMIGAGDWA
jgi:hypothetical protein